MGLLGQFDNHYKRKEELFFPLMEQHGHDAPPRVMWGVDDDIRELFQKAQAAVDKLPEVSIAEVSQAFETFAHEFEEMIFKEEAILLMILLEALTQDDWLAIADESDAYGYAIIKPTTKWQPKRESFESEKPGSASATVNSDDSCQTNAELNDNLLTKVIDMPEGQFTISFTPKKEKLAVDRTTTQPFGNGYLSVEQANLILNHLPLEISFVNKDDIFQYFNNNTVPEKMVFKRTPSQIGRNVELCHPPKVLDKVKKVFKLLRSGERDKVVMWFKSEKMEKFIHITYAAIRDENGDFQGVLEYVQDIQEFLDIDSDVKRDI